jgi:hypothetical protein
MSSYTEWDGERLALVCDSVQDHYRRGIELADDDPRVQYVAAVLHAGREILDRLLDEPDGEAVVGVIDRLSPDVLRLLVFERAWAEGRARERG